MILRENKYRDRLVELLKQACPRLASRHELDFKNVFGAVGAYVNGHIFISCGKFGVALRPPRETLQVIFKEKGAKHLKYFPNGHIKKEYAVLTGRILTDKRQFKNLVNKSIKYVHIT